MTSLDSTNMNVNELIFTLGSTMNTMKYISTTTYYQANISDDKIDSSSQVAVGNMVVKPHKFILVTAYNNPGNHDILLDSQMRMQFSI